MGSFAPLAHNLKETFVRGTIEIDTMHTSEAGSQTVVL